MLPVYQLIEEPVYWLSPLDRCNQCDGPFNELMYDAATRRGWGNFCHTCFIGLGCRLGTGLGQRYERQPDGRWLKTAG